MHETEDNDGAEITLALPAVWQICGFCEGDGKSCAYLGSYTWEEMHEQGEEFIEDYFSGAYDRQCSECSGSGKIRVIDRETANPEDLTLYDRDMDERYAAAAEQAAEIAMGA